MPRYTQNAKEVLRDGKHFADCIDDGAAKMIAEALNERRGMSQTQHSLPLDDNGPLFVDIPSIQSAHMRYVCRYPSIRQENDEYACSCGARWDIAEGEDHP